MTSFFMNRTIWLILLLLNILLAAGSITMEWYFSYFPCYLCLFQRLLFMVTVVLALVGLVLTSIGFFRRLCAILVMLTSLVGGATAIYMLWLQAQPKGSVSCQTESLGFIQNLIDSLGRSYPDFFLATGMCTDAYAFLGISLPLWALIFFAVNLLLAIVIYVHRDRPRYSGLSFR